MLLIFHTGAFNEQHVDVPLLSEPSSFARPSVLRSQIVSSSIASAHIDYDRPLHAIFIGRETHGCRLRLHETWSRLSVAPTHTPSKLSSSIVWVSGVMPSVESSISHEVLLRIAYFALAPRGNGGSSFRITEAVKAGAIPIYIWGGADQTGPALPFRNRIDWSRAAIVLEDHEQQLTHVIIDCYSREVLSQMRSYLNDVSQFFYVPGFLNAMMDDIQTSLSDSAGITRRKSIMRRLEHPHYPPAWIIAVSVGLTRWNACSSEGSCSVSSSNGVVAALYLSFLKMFLNENWHTSRLTFFNFFMQKGKSSCSSNQNIYQESLTSSFTECLFTYMNPNRTQTEAKVMFCNEAALAVSTAFSTLGSGADHLTPSNLARALRIFRHCKKDSSNSSAIYSHLLNHIVTICNNSSASSTCTDFLSKFVKSELATARFSDIFFREGFFSMEQHERNAQLPCRSLHVYSSIPSSIHHLRIFSALLGSIQVSMQVKVVYPEVQLPSATSLHHDCDTVSKLESVKCVLIAFEPATIQLYDMFQPHFWRPAELDINERHSMFHSTRALWFALNSSCSAIDVVDATAVPEQNIVGIFQAFVAALSLNDTVRSVFTDNLPVRAWELLPVTIFSDHHIQFITAPFSSQFKQVASLIEDQRLSSQLKDAQASLSSSVGAWPPCIIAYLPTTPCTNVSCLQSLTALAQDCSGLCDDTSMVIIGDATSPLSDATLSLLQEALRSVISRMFYVDNDDVFFEREDAATLYMLSSSSCGFISANSSTIGTQAVLTR